MRIIVIGASGKIGSALHSCACRAGHSTIGTYCSSSGAEGLVHFDMLTESIGSVIPDLNSEDQIYLLSAYTSPNWVYENQLEAEELNIRATKRIIDAAREVDARVLFTSSVEVFDGKAPPYNELSRPNPLNLYGQMKLEIENYLKAGRKNFCIVRTGWNVSWNPNDRCVVRMTYDTLLENEARMARDNSFSIADVHDVGKGLLALAQKKEIQCCHLASMPSIRRTELAELVIESSAYGKDMSFREIDFSELNYSEGRGRQNDIDSSFAVENLGISFRSPRDIVRKKVSIIDASKE